MPLPYTFGMLLGQLVPVDEMLVRGRFGVR